MKNIARTLLLVFVFSGIAYYAWSRIAGSGDAPEPSAASADAASSALAAPVVVTYFSSDVRCPTCLEIEALTRRTVEERFADPLERGQIAFQVLNMDEKENAHFIADYDLAFKTVVINGSVRDGDVPLKPWVKMDDVWTLTDEPDEFIDYLAKEISRRLPKAG